MTSQLEICPVCNNGNNIISVPFENIISEYSPDGDYCKKCDVLFHLCELCYSVIHDSGTLILFQSPNMNRFNYYIDSSIATDMIHSYNLKNGEITLKGFCYGCIRSYDFVLNISRMKSAINSKGVYS